MAKWEYTVDGVSLRSAIGEGDIEQILDELYKCVKTLRLKKVMDIYDFNDFEDQIAVLKGDFEDGDLGTEEVDCLLTDFYDFCDDNKVWVTMY